MALNMTKGKPSRLIILFSLPMLLGNLFQQFYNVVDTIVVGRFVSYNALAAVGASFAILTFVNSIIIGLCMGSAVLFSHQYGAGETEKLKRAITTSFLFVMLFSLLLALTTLATLGPIIKLYQMPPDTVAYAKDYLFYLFIGIFFTGLYNFCAFLLRAIGDSKSPLLFLVLACIINIILDLVLVLVIPLEVEGVAIATLIAQAVSALGCFAFTLKKLSFMGLSITRLVFDKPQFKTILEFSLLTSIQQSVMNFGILMVQGLVNTFGAITVAAFSAGVKVDAFAYMPLQDFGNAFSTFVAQNHGAGQTRRIQQGLRFSVRAIAVFSIILSLATYFLAPFLIGLFVGNQEQVIAIGTHYLRIEGLFYILIGYLFLFYGYFRGMGNPKVSIILTFVSLGSRVVLAYLFASLFGFSSIGVSIVLGWLLANLTGLYFYKKINRVSVSS